MTLRYIEKILTHSSSLSIFLPIVAGIWNYKKNDRLQLNLFYYLIFSACIEAIIAYLSHRHINNMPIFHIGTLIEYLFIAYLFYFSVKTPLYKSIILFGTACYLLFSAIWLYGYADLYTFNHETRIFESLLLAFYALCYFNFLSKDISTRNLSFKTIPMFWISLGILLYFTGNFFLFLFYKYISAIVPEVWSIHSILNIATNILFTISFLCKAK